MYLHRLTDSREAGTRLERFFRWLRGQRMAAVGGVEIPMTILRSDGHVAIRMEIPGLEVSDLRVEDHVVQIRLHPSDRLAGDGNRGDSSVTGGDLLDLGPTCQGKPANVRPRYRRL
jgi:HSP20 family molecular chaperone IbpA